MRSGWMHTGLVSLLVFALLTGPLTSGTSAWSNGGKSPEPSRPRYGTHDWIAQHAADLLPESEGYFITEHMETFLYGTEVPDIVYSDTANHHVYFYPDGGVMEDDAASRARLHFHELVDALRKGDALRAAGEAGIMSHYMDDVAVFGHVLSSKTHWGAEKHHSDFESDVQGVTSSYNSAFFTVSPDGLERIDAYNATLDVAGQTTFGDASAGHTARWLDDNYVNGMDSWSVEFRDRIAYLIDLAVNRVADVIHTAVLDANATDPGRNSGTPYPIPKLTQTQMLYIGLAVGVLLIVAVSFIRRWKGRPG